MKKAEIRPLTIKCYTKRDAERLYGLLWQIQYHNLEIKDIFSNYGLDDKRAIKIFVKKAKGENK